MRIKTNLPIIILLLLVLYPAFAFGSGTQVIRPGLLKKAATGENELRVIVILKNRQSLKGVPVPFDSALRNNVQEYIAGTQSSIINRISPDELRVNVRFKNIPALGATVTAKGLLALAGLEEVALIQEDRPIYPSAGQAAPDPAALPQPRARADLFSGRNVSIAIVGSGIDYQNELMGGGGFPNSKVIGGYDFGDNDDDPMDCHGHETGVAFVAGYEVAPQAKLYALKICPGCCSTEPSWVSKMVEAWDWCVTHKDDNPAYPIKIINTSWADYSIHTSFCDEADPAVALAAANCKANGIGIFVAAGNMNLCDGLPLPSCMSGVFSVGAVYQENGPPKTYCLPAQGCRSWPSDSCGGWEWACRDDVVLKDRVSCCSNSAEFLSLLAPSGGQTSGSAPHAAGAAAVLQSYLKETEGAFQEVDEMIRTMYGYSTWIFDFKSSLATPRIDVDEMIGEMEKGE